MELEDELFIEDDVDMLDIIDFGFPRKIYDRSNYFEDMDDLAFFRRFRLTKQTTLRVLELLEDSLECDNDLNNSVSPINQLLTALLFYANDGHQINIADFMKMDQSTVCKIIEKVSAAIAGLRSQFIKMPSTHEEILANQNEFYRIARFPRTVGCIDGTHIRIRSPGEVFRNRKSYFSINTQIITDADLKICNIVSRWPGSAHDATIFNNSRIRNQFEAGEFQNGLLLGDSGYPLRPYLLTPLANPTTHAQQLFNETHIQTRNSVERTIGVWKRRFPCLASGLRTKVETSMVIIIATAVLHNIARTMHEEVPPPAIGINVEELEYLMLQNNIPVTYPQENLHDVRSVLIDNYFANL